MRLISGLILGPLTLAVIVLGGWFFKIFVAVAFGLSVKEWVRMARQGKNLIRDSVLGILYLIMPYIAFIELRINMEQGLFLTFALLLGVWGSDIAAYFSGKLIGGAKMAESISPNKTWAGFLGGMLGSAVTLAVLNELANPVGELLNTQMHAFMSLPQAIIVGALFTVFGQAGDLLISIYKRRVGVKDTGTLIPGHGGLLDRIDSLLMVTPFFYIALLI